MTRTSIIGGESSHRSRLGGTVPSWRIAVLGFTGVLALVLMITLEAPGLVIGVALTGGAWLLTANTARGSVLERWIKRERWRERGERGVRRFQPFDQDDWDALAAQARAKSRKVRQAARAQSTAMRETPDGASGMGWLEQRRRRPGIAWHAPVGEEPYLSVTFEVSGQLRGLESQVRAESAAQNWGRLIADLADEESLAKSVHPVTRVLPPDSARHQAWLLGNLDPTVPIEFARSYDELVRRADSQSMIQRHYVAVRWPLSGTFKAKAARYGAGQDGWRTLMHREIGQVAGALRAAGHDQVEALSATRVAAVITHMQNPSHPIDRVQGVDPNRLGVATLDDQWSAHVVQVVDDAGEEQLWWHRTARIRAQDMQTVPRDLMWLAPLLGGTQDAEGLITWRTLAFHIWGVPAESALKRTTRDRTRDRADQMSESEAGRLGDGTALLKMSAADRRARDLSAGEGHSGVEWVAYLTVSARSREELIQACDRALSLAKNRLLIHRLEWQDTYQSAASGCTWPIARGIHPPTVTSDARLMGALTGRGSKEEL